MSRPDHASCDEIRPRSPHSARCGFLIVIPCPRELTRIPVPQVDTCDCKEAGVLCVFINGTFVGATDKGVTDSWTIVQLRDIPDSIIILQLVKDQ
jgi:hypothetical protein